MCVDIVDGPVSIGSTIRARMPASDSRPKLNHSYVMTNYGFGPVLLLTNSNNVYPRTRDSPTGGNGNVHILTQKRRQAKTLHTLEHRKSADVKLYNISTHPGPLASVEDDGRGERDRPSLRSKVLMCIVPAVRFKSPLLAVRVESGI